MSLTSFRIKQGAGCYLRALQLLNDVVVRVFDFLFHGVGHFNSIFSRNLRVQDQIQLIRLRDFHVRRILPFFRISTAICPT